MNVVELLRERAASHPERVAIVDAASGTSLTYAALDDATARVAAALGARGLRARDTVLILHPVAPALYVALIGMLRAGIVPAVPPPGADRAALARCVRAYPPNAVLAGGIGWAAVAATAGLRHVTRLSTTATPFAYDIVHACAGRRDIAEPCDDEAPAMLAFTSGSTGAPKAMLRTHGVARAQVAALREALALDGGVALATMPMVLLADLAAGATCVLPGVDLRRPGAVDGDVLAERMRAHGVTRIVASPALLANLAAALRRREDATLPTLRTIVSGGAPVMPPLAAALRAVAPNATLTACYGSTEAEPIAILEAGAASSADHAAMRAGAGLLAGVPYAGGCVAILATQPGALAGPFEDDDAVEQRALQPGAVGEIVVCGPHVVPRSCDPLDDVATKIRAGTRIWHRTGDLGYRDRDGRLWLVGRAAGVIDDAHGVLEPLRVECALSYLRGIARSAIASVDGLRVLVVEPAAGARADERAIRAAVPFAAIDRIVVAPVPVDPRHNAKVDYTALQRVADRYAHVA